MGPTKAKPFPANWNIEPPARERSNKEWAAHYISERFPVVPDHWKIGDVHEYLSQNSREFDNIDYVYVVNASRKLVGVLSMRDIFSHPKKTEVRAAMERRIVSASPETHRERIAQLALQHELRAIPIVKNQQLEGVVPTHKILHQINRVLRGTILQLSGVHPDHLEYDDTMHVPLFRSLLHRAPWLIIGLAGVIVAAGIIGKFEQLLDKHLIFAFFIPAIVYMSDALGTQNQTLLIRDMALMGKELKMLPYVIKTMAIAVLISALIGGLVYVLTLLFWNDPFSAGVITLAMMATLLVSAISSMGTTFLFQWMGQDPALGSGPFATIISDLTSILIYFLIVAALV